jgi:hypothetical protein
LPEQPPWACRALCSSSQAIVVSQSPSTLSPQPKLSIASFALRRNASSRTAIHVPASLVDLFFASPGSARSFIECANFALKADFNGLAARSVYNEKKQSSDSAGTDG